MKYVIDRFGKDVETKPKSDDHFTATAKVSMSPKVYSWAFMFAVDMKLLSPRRAVNKTRGIVEEVLK